MSMRKTIREWIDLCADDTIREKWLINHLRNPYRNSELQKWCMAEALSSQKSFSWLNSPDGYDFWHEIWVDMGHNPEKYLKKKKVMFHEYEDN